MMMEPLYTWLAAQSTVQTPIIKRAKKNTRREWERLKGLECVKRTYMIYMAEEMFYSLQVCTQLTPWRKK